MDHSVGIIYHAKVGDKVAPGDPLFTIHANSADTLSMAHQRLLAAIGWSEKPMTPPSHIRQIIG